MPHVPGALTADQIIGYAQTMGVDVSPTQFERWRKYGLIPRPLDRPGQGRGKGRKGRYDPSVVPLLGAIKFAVTTQGRLDRAAWQLWCLGFPVTRGARRALLDYLERQETRAQRRLNRDHRDSGVVGEGDPIDRLEYVSLPKSLSRVRRRMGRVEFAAAARLLNEMLLGEFQRVSPSHRPNFKTVAQAIIRLSRPETIDRGSFPDNLATALRLISERADLRILREKVAQSSDWLLEAVRDEARAVWRAACALSGQTETPLSMPIFLLWAGALLTNPGLSNFMIDLELAGHETWRALKRSPLEKCAIEHPELRFLLPMLTKTSKREGTL